MKLEPLWRRAHPARPLGARRGPSGEVLALLIALVTLTILTQWTAHSLGFAGVLGAPLATLGDPRVWRGLALLTGVGSALTWWRRPELRDAYRLGGILSGLFVYLGSAPLYLPVMFPVWWLRLRHEPVLAEFFERRALWGVGILVALGGVALAVRARFPRERTAPDLAGSARWAETADLEAAGFLDQEKPGVVVGQWRRRGKRVHLRDCGPHHIFVQGGARSGKGVGIVVPTALTWPGTLIYSGKFAEIEALTRGYRESLGPVWAFSPTGFRDRYNPLADLRPEPYREADIDELAKALALPSSDSRESTWTRGGAQLLSAVLHYAVATEGPRASLAGCRARLGEGDEGLDRLSEHPDPRIADYPNHLLGLAERTRSSFVSAAMDGLAPYTSRGLVHATSDSDFGLVDLLYSTQPATLYLDTSSNSLGARSALRLLLRQLLVRVSAPDNQAPDPDGGPMRSLVSHRILMLLDEFPLFGKIDVIADKLEEVPGFGVRFVFVVQNLPRHLKEWAEPGTQIDAIFAGCQNHITYGGTDPQTCRVFSELLGKTTEHYTTRSDRQEIFEVLDRNIQRSPHYAGRELLTPDELRRLPAGQVVIVPRGCPPARTEHVRYYEEDELRSRSLLRPPAKSGEKGLAARLEELAARCPGAFAFEGGAARWLRRLESAERIAGVLPPGAQLPDGVRGVFADREALEDGRRQLELAMWLLEREGTEVSAAERTISRLLWFLPEPGGREAPFSLGDVELTARALVDLAQADGGRGWSALVPKETLAAVHQLLGWVEGAAGERPDALPAWLEEPTEESGLRSEEMLSYLQVLMAKAASEEAEGDSVAWRWWGGVEPGGDVWSALSVVLRHAGRGEDIADESALENMTSGEETRQERSDARTAGQVRVLRALEPRKRLDALRAVIWRGTSAGTKEPGE